MSKLGGERVAVQNALIRYAEETGWEYVGPEEALRLRGGETRLVFKDLFIDRMQRLNPDYMDHLLADDLISRLQHIPPNIEGNLIAWEYLKGIGTVFVPNEDRERNVAFIDPENIDRNAFHVTDEFEFSNGTHSNRADVVFLINGVPVFIIETKSSDKHEGIAEALDQIRRYHRETPELLALLQVHGLTHIVRFYYGPTWNLSKKALYNWKHEAEGDFEALVKSFLDRERVVRLLTDFILFTRQDDELSKVVLRPHQMRAVQKVVARAADPEKQRGLVWHTQGSGKTYTMIVAAQQIIQNPVFENPTVLMLVDRNELETQLFGNLAAVGVEHVAVAENKRHLRQVLAGDRRGLIVSMIHKFEDMPEKTNTRENIFVLVDEAHRTTGGQLGNFLMGGLPNAVYIGFTGTPIDKTSYGQSTFVTFGVDDPPHGYLDKYSIAESIEDGTTVPLHYTLAPNELRVDRETLETEFLDLAEAEGVSDVDELNKVLERAVTLRNMLKNRERVDRVGRYVAEHYVGSIEPMGYKAFLVGVDREACALYKQELDKHLSAEWSQVVYSPDHPDTEELARYHLSERAEKQVRKSFRNPEALPKILIVTEKLLTGFDAPILYCIYLDKPMRDHVLLQAIARVNRPYEDEEGRKKPCGFVLDFVGVFEHLEKALAFDSADIEGVMHDLEVLRKRFAERMARARADYLPMVRDGQPDTRVEAVLVHFGDEDARQQYYGFYRELSDIYEILSPDAFLRDYIDDYDTLSRIYAIVREAYDPGIPVDREFSRKTAKLVQERTESSEIKATVDIYEINEDTLRLLQESGVSDTEKVFNLTNSILAAVQQQRSDQPYLISIGERAERIAELYKQRQTTTQQALEELEELIGEINEARREQAERDMPTELFSIFWVLRAEGIENAEHPAKEMQEAVERFPHFRTSARHERGIEHALNQQLIESGLRDPASINEITQQVVRVLTGGSQ